MFSLHPRLRADCLDVVEWPLCSVLLLNDSRYPWLVLVPRRADIREIHQLSADDRAALIEEIASASAALQAMFSPDKINVGALGNLVPQLHVHVLGRRTDDEAWPGPVWGVGTAIPYADTDAADTVFRLRQVLENR